MASDKQFVFIYLGIALFFNVMGMDANSFWPPFKQTLTPKNSDNTKDQGKQCNFCPSFSPCKNGKCVNKECGFTCVCNQFYVGLHCETYIKNNPWIEQNVDVGVATAVPPAPTTTTTKTTTTTTKKPPPTTTTTATPSTTKHTPASTNSKSTTTTPAASAKSVSTKSSSTTTKSSSAIPKVSATYGAVKPIISGNNLPLKSNEMSKSQTTTVASATGTTKPTQKDKTNSDASDVPPTKVSTTTTTTTATTTTTTKKGSTQQEDD